MEDVIFFGSAVKALGNGKVGGHLVIFGDSAKTDLVGEYFTKNTDFGMHTSTPVLYNHGMDKTLKSRSLGTGAIKIDEVGVWLEAQLEMRDEYEQAVYKMAEDGKLGWSSGTASHLVEKKSVGNATEITAWALGLDASLTPTPCEPRTMAIPLKTWKAEQLAYPVKLYDPLENIAEQTISGALSRLDDVLWEARYQCAYDDTATIDEKVAMFRNTCNGIADAGEKIIRALSDTPAEELAEAKALVTRQRRMSAKDVHNERDFDRYLREAGFAREAAKALTAKGYKGLNQREVEETAKTETKRNEMYYRTRIATLEMETL